MKHNWVNHTLESLCEIEKGTFPIMKTLPGKFTFVVTGANFKTADKYDFDCEAVCVPLVSSTGHGNAAMHRVHYIKGKFALSNLLCAIIPKKESQLASKFLFHLLMTKKEEYFVPLMKGTSNVSLSTRQIGAVTIPLPPLSEQKRIIQTIDSVKSKLDQIKELRNEQFKEVNNLLFSKYTELIDGPKWFEMREVAPIIRRGVNINDDELYPELGIRCFGKGTFHKPAITGLEVGTKTLYQIKKRDLVFSNVFAWEGGIAVAKEDDNDRYGSHRFISCIANKEKANEEFLCFHFLSPKGLEDINACSPGGAGRNKTLGLDKLMRIKVPVPDIDLQNEFVELLHKVNTIKNHHNQTEKELTQLLPSLLDKAFKGEL